MRAPYTQELLDRAQAYVQQPLNNRRYAEGLADITTLYSEITGEPASTCRQCQYSNYLAVVTAYIREATRSLHPELMADSKYTFAPGFENEAIADARYTKVVKAENLTDQDAEYLLKLGYEHVIVLKPGQEPLLAGASEQAEGDELGEDSADVENARPLVPEADLQAEQHAHEATKSELTAEKQAYERVAAQYNEANAARVQAEGALATEKQAHKATKGELTKAKNELARKNTVPPTSAAPTEPVLTASTTSTAPDGPAEVAPAPPAAPAAGTAGN